MFLMWLGEQITARHRQRHFADHLLGHRRRPAFGYRRHARTGTHRCAVDGHHPCDHRACDRGHRPDRVLPSARSARLLIQYPKRQVGNRIVPGRHVAPATEAQHRGRHSADLRVVAASAAGYRGGLLGHHDAADMGLRGPGRAWPRTAALHAVLRLDDRVLRVLLHGHRVQSQDTADQLKKHSGFIPGYRPGERTAEYIDYVHDSHHGGWGHIPRRGLA